MKTCQVLKSMGNRRAMDETTESFSATITPVLSDGSKTIVAQYHASGTGTIVKVYVSDTNESNHDDSIPGNGIFDVYVRMRPRGSDDEDIIDFGTMRNGQSFDLSVVNRQGLVTVEAMGVSRTMRVEDSDAAYLKYGNYLQAQDPFSGEKFSTKSYWPTFYRTRGITTSTVRFSNIGYTRG